MRALLTALACLVGAGLLGPKAYAAESAPKVDLKSVEGLIDFLGTPPRWEVVEILVHMHGAARGEAGLRMVEALSRVGGTASARGLGLLLARGDDPVRTEGLRAIAAVGIRVPEALLAARDAWRQGPAAVRLAACEALGYVGTGDDVESLLEALVAQDPELAPRAYAALVRLSGAKLPYVPSRWTWWWKSTAEQGRVALRAALFRSDRPLVPLTEAELAEVESVVQRWGWLDLNTVANATRAWFCTLDPNLRSLACRVAAGLKLGELAEDVRSAAIFATDDGVEAAARQASAVLGVPLGRGPRSIASVSRTD